MPATDLQVRYRDCLRNAWAELPRLVDDFIVRLTETLPVSNATVQDAVAELLDLKGYEQFEGLCQLLSRVHPYLSADNPEDHGAEQLEPTPAQRELRGLAWSVLQAWKLQGWEGVSQVCARHAEPLERVPFEELGSESRSAWEALAGFLDEATHLRERVLEGFVLAASPAATEDAVDYALDLADVLSRTVDESVPALAAAVLRTRGLDELSGDELAELWDDDSGYDLQDWALLDRAEDPHVDTHAERLERTDGGCAPVWQLRQACVALSPNTLSGYYDDAPTLFGVLTQAPDEARFRINAQEDGPQDYLVPAVHFEGYVRCFSDIPAMLRCAPRLPEAVNLVSAEDALRMGCPALAGWYRLDWSRCL